MLLHMEGGRTLFPLQLNESFRLTALFIITEHSCKPEIVQGQGSVAMASVTGIQMKTTTHMASRPFCLKTQMVEVLKQPQDVSCLYHHPVLPKAGFPVLSFSCLCCPEKPEGTSDILTVLFNVHRRLSGKWLSKAQKCKEVVLPIGRHGKLPVAMSLYSKVIISIDTPAKNKLK